MKSFWSYLINNIITIPFSFFSYLIPKNDKIWVFGAWYGKRYNDNSRFLYEYVNKFHKDIKTIWLTRDLKMFKKLKNNNKNVYLIKSFLGIYYSFIAKYQICCNTAQEDLNKYSLCSKNYIINLWHGAPIKNIDPLSKNGKYAMKIVDYLKKLFFYPKINLFCSLSENDKKIFKKRFSKNVIITGFPRNDILYKTNKNKSKIKKILYLPTFRGCYNKTKKTNFFENLNIKIFSKWLKNNHITFYTKLHPLDNNENKNLQTNNFKFIKDDEIDELYVFLKDIDILITDYSSVVFDFLFTNKPIILYAFDLKKYKKTQGMYYNLKNIAPGPVCNKWSEVINEIKKINKNNDKYKNKRKKIAKQFIKHYDNKSCQRIIKYILNNG